VTKILVLSDIHGRGDIAAAVADSYPEIDHILVAGDITNFGDADEARSVAQALIGDRAPRSILLVAGNCDPLSARRYMSAARLDIEGRAFEAPFGTLVGAGGGLKRAGLTSFERREGELKEALEKWLALASGEGRQRPLIVMTHSPPYGTNADRLGGKHVGSTEYARMLLEYAPDVWICGHIHESRCVSLEDGTLVVNPGPCGSGCHAILEIKEGPDGKALVRAELSK